MRRRRHEESWLRRRRRRIRKGGKKRKGRQFALRRMRHTNIPQKTHVHQLRKHSCCLAHNEE